MILRLKTSFKKRRFPSFTLIEVLAALVIIGIGVTSTLTLIVNVQKYLSMDKELGRVVTYTDNYLSKLYLSGNLKSDLFNKDEIAKLSVLNTFPVLMPPAETNLGENIKVLVNRKINRWDPLLVDIGIESIITYVNKSSTNIKPRKRDYWIETTFSENYLKKLE
jgi:prepilin-type N-terminal cleavage/methylation domain-containing protein